MYIYNETYPLNKFPCVRKEILSGQTLLLNIETTGLSPKNAYIWMISTCHFADGCWQFTYRLADNRRDEEALLWAFSKEATAFHAILTYGGHTFTYPFLSERFTNYSDTPSIFSVPILQIDILQMLSHYKHIFPVENFKKQTMESFLGLKRTHPLTGKELIKLFGEWELQHTVQQREALIYHNREDLQSLILTSQLQSYVRFFEHCAPQSITRSLTETQLIVHLFFDKPFPVALTYTTGYADIRMNGCCVDITLSLFKGKLKYFLPGPIKDYYYLPAEDQAIHNSVACYVDKSYRKKATAATCYTLHEGLFVPTNKTGDFPYFQENYRSKPYYFCCDEAALIKNPDALLQYVKTIIL